MTDEPPRGEKARWAASIGFWLGLVLFLLVFVIPSSEEDGSLAPEARRVAAITFLCVVWWITEPIPIPATSLIPLVLFPVLGVLPAKDASKAYVNDLIMLLMGGFFLSQAIQKCGLHRRIALKIVASIGRRPGLVILGFMIATGAISMWISNTATCLMILPIAVAVLSQVFEVNPQDRAGAAAFGTALLLGVAYGASVGGIGTPIGTPPNLAYLKLLPESFPSAPTTAFPQWMGYTAPLVVILIPLIWLLITKVLCRVPVEISLGEKDVLKDDLVRLGPMSRAERRVLGLFAVTAFLWLFRRDIPLNHEGAAIPGVVTLLAKWKVLPAVVAHQDLKFIGDGTIAVFMAILFFLIRTGEGRRETLLDWETASKIPWGLLLLFGGGLAIATGFKETGLSDWVGHRLAFVEDFHPIFIIASVCLLMTFLTEVTSNTAITLVMLPILAGLAREIEVNPILLMLPATISASFAFMLPVATGPNAVVFSSGRVPIDRMARVGFVLNLIGAAVVTAYVYFVLVKGFGMAVELPDWARFR